MINVTDSAVKQLQTLLVDTAENNVPHGASVP